MKQSSVARRLQYAAMVQGKVKPRSGIETSAISGLMPIALPARRVTWAKRLRGGARSRSAVAADGSSRITPECFHRRHAAADPRIENRTENKIGSVAAKQADRPGKESAAAEVWLAIDVAAK